MNFGLKVRGLRLKNGLTQHQLAEESEVTLRTIQRIENNEVKPSLYSMRKLSEALGQDLNQLKTVECGPEEQMTQLKPVYMNQFFQDLKMLIKNNWKFLMISFIIIWFLGNYTDIKSGISDGWNNL